MSEKKTNVCQTCGGDPGRHDMMCKGTDPMPDVQRYLTKEEWERYLGLMGYAAVHSAMDASIVTELTESLSACRALLEKHQPIRFYEGLGVRECSECHRSESLTEETALGPMPHHPDCAIAAELAGVKGKK